MQGIQEKQLTQPSAYRSSRGGLLATVSAMPHLLDAMDARGLASLQQTSKAFAKACQEPILWRRHVAGMLGVRTSALPKVIFLQSEQNASQLTNYQKVYGELQRVEKTLARATHRDWSQAASISDFSSELGNLFSSVNQRNQGLSPVVLTHLHLWATQNEIQRIEPRANEILQFTWKDFTCSTVVSMVAGASVAAAWAVPLLSQALGASASITRTLFWAAPSLVLGAYAWAMHRDARDRLHHVGWDNVWLHQETSIAALRHLIACARFDGAPTPQNDSP